jgi:ribosome-binding protein aMBF1 (putative translation factor)
LFAAIASEGSMDVATAERELVESMKRFVKAELKRADLTYEELAAKLRERGFNETKVSVTNKLSRGTFPATFFVAVMRAIGRETVNLADV